MPKITFTEKEFQIRDFESFIFWSNIFFFGDCLKKKLFEQEEHIRFKSL